MPPSTQLRSFYMPYIVLKPCIADGARRAVGDVLNLSDKDAKSLTAMSRVEYVDAPQPAPVDTNRAVDMKAKPMSAPRKRKSGK